MKTEDSGNISAIAQHVRQVAGKVIMMDFEGSIIINTKFQAPTFNKAEKINDEIAKDVACVVSHLNLVSETVSFGSCRVVNGGSRFYHRRAYSHEQVSSALCVWEWMLENRDRSLRELFNGHGSASMRECAAQAGDICNRLYDHMKSANYEHNGSYDWDFIPLACRFIDWPALHSDHQLGSDIYDPDLDTLLAAMIAADMASYPDPEHRLFQKDGDEV